MQSEGMGYSSIAALYVFLSASAISVVLSGQKDSSNKRSLFSFSKNSLLVRTLWWWWCCHFASSVWVVKSVTLEMCIPMLLSSMRATFPERGWKTFMIFWVGDSCSTEYDFKKANGIGRDTFLSM